MQISLKAARVNAKIAQKEAAKSLGVNVGTLSAWENGKSYPDALSLKSLCASYGVTMDNIFFASKSTLS